MQKELERLQGELESAKVQIKYLHSQNLAKDSELQQAKASKANESISNLWFNVGYIQDNSISASNSLLSY